ncbi:sodium-dependent nutrient amino acid transporter 1-like [Dermacentor variabilis]|uniref:sodium-dependent nutrient amino acid transporter 1-like n=1 Tax=Dermacentor variabilis TaxID=34621 RepID=UPI003F5B83A9
MGDLTWKWGLDRQSYGQPGQGQVEQEGADNSLPRHPPATERLVFLAVYLVMLCIVAVPMLYLEIFLGQFCGWSVPRAFGGFPMAKGLGWTMLYSDMLLALSYIPPAAYCIVYIAALFEAELPWSTCGGGEHGAEERGCYHVKPGTYPCSKVNETLARRYWARNYSGEAAIVVNGSGGQEPVSVPFREYEALRSSCVNGTVSAARAFFERHVANLDSSSESISDSSVGLLLAMIIGWILVLISISMGLRSMKKASALLLGLRLALLTLLCVASCTLSGAGDGLRELLRPQLSKLYSDKTWISASQHMFYSVGISVGTVTFLASHNEFDWPILSTAWKVAMADFLFGLFTSCVAFGIYGHLANTFAVEVIDIATGGDSIQI